MASLGHNELTKCWTGDLTWDLTWTQTEAHLRLTWIVTWDLSQFNTLRSRQDGRHFPDDIFKCIFLNENVWILIKISLKFVPKVPINNIPALVLIMAWRRPGDKPLSKPMMVNLPTHIICVTRPQWVKENQWHSQMKPWLKSYIYIFLFLVACDILSPRVSGNNYDISTQYTTTSLFIPAWISNHTHYMGQVMKLRLSCYLVLLSR